MNFVLDRNMTVMKAVMFRLLKCIWSIWKSTDSPLWLNWSSKLRSELKIFRALPHLLSAVHNLYHPTGLTLFLHRKINWPSECNWEPKGRVDRNHSPLQFWTKMSTNDVDTTAVTQRHKCIILSLKCYKMGLDHFYLWKKVLIQLKKFQIINKRLC